MSIEKELLDVGVAHHQAGQLHEAEQIYHRLLVMKPDHPTALHLIGVLDIQRGNFGQAIERIQRAIELWPTNPEFYGNLGIAFEKLDQLDSAMEAYQRALALRPDYPEALNNLGLLLTGQGRSSEAVELLQRALQIRPNYPDALNNQGNAFKELGEFQSAIESYQAAIQLRPDFADAYENLGGIFETSGDREVAIECYRRNWQLRPNSARAAAALLHQLQHVCDWEQQEELATRILAAIDEDTDRPHDRVTPFAVIGLPIATTPKQQYRAARRWVQTATSPSISDKRITEARVIHDKESRSEGSKLGVRSKLRVGYLSADFNEHPVAYLVAEMLEQHARDRFQIFGYSITQSDNSPIGQRVCHAFDVHHVVQDLTTSQTIARITEDQIDILVDLQGHTLHARTQVLAARPAPIQVNYLGFAGTMGADFIDYILVDDYVAPAHEQPYYSEKLVHLPGCFMVQDRHREIDERPLSRSDVGLPDDRFVFCAFSPPFKISPMMFDVWMRLLSNVPDSLLWMRVDQKTAVENIRNRANQHGIAEDRLVFAPRVAMPKHLARHRLADLFLDTYPYNQHSTAGDALRMGLPLLTLSGPSFASRVAGSLLRELDLIELIAHDPLEYEAKALHFAHHRDPLVDVRKRLSEQLKTTALFDGQRKVRQIENAYESMFKERN